MLAENLKIIEYRRCHELERFVRMSDGSLLPVELCPERLVFTESKRATIVGSAEGWRMSKESENV